MNNSGTSTNSGFKYKIPYPKFNLTKKNGKNGKNSNSSPSVLANFLYLLLIVLILCAIVMIAMTAYYLLTDCPKGKKPLGQYLLDFTFDPCLNGPDRPLVREILDEKEVFHISDQIYTYEEAKCKCQAYGGRLATKQEIIEAYNKGADWCSYGWSAGQTAYYPTQKCTWDRLQQGDPKNRWKCGRAGVNGGYFSNPKLRFGINCYGVKPKGKVVKEKIAYCPPEQACGEMARSKLRSDSVAPFNNDKWSRFD